MKNNKIIFFNTITDDKQTQALEEFIKAIDENFYFCHKCGKRLSKLSIKRHYKEIHLSLKIVCPICHIKVKRITPHLDNHLQSNINTKILNLDSVFDENSDKNNITDFEYNIHNVQDEKIYLSIFQKYKNDTIKFVKKAHIFKTFIIGEGKYSQFIFGLINNNFKEPIGIKLYKEMDDKKFYNELNILKNLEKFNVFPKVLTFEKNRRGNFIGQTLLGVDLFKLLEFENNKLDTITILNIAKDIIFCLSLLNRENISHCDLKGDNFIWNIFNDNKNINKIILSDFSCSVAIDEENRYSKIGSN